MNANDEDNRTRADVWNIYEAAQNSAEHHDTLLWEVTYIVWGSTTLLVGFVLEAIESEPLLCLVTAFLAIFMTMMVLILAMSYRQVRNKKYQICKEIEVALHMKWKQHSDVDTYSPKEIQTKWYCASTIFFVVVWTVVAARSVYLLCSLHRGH